MSHESQLHQKHSFKALIHREVDDAVDSTVDDKEEVTDKDREDKPERVDLAVAEINIFKSLKPVVQQVQEKSGNVADYVDHYNGSKS